VSGGNVEHGLDVARIEDKLAVILLHLRSNTCIVHSESRKLDKMLASCFRGGSVVGSRVVSVLDSGAEKPGFKSQSRLCRVTVLGKLLTPIVHQAAKLVAALLGVAGVTAGLAESNGSLQPGL